tara:strand:+ start:684 stop:1367 length:684 start_codon:yes stop_codon:yes gene_type:complete
MNKTEEIEEIVIDSTIEKEIETLKDDEDSFFDIEKEFLRQTEEINTQETEENTIIDEETVEFDTEFEDETPDETPDEIDEEIEEIPAFENQLTSETIADLLANLHNVILPPAIIGIHKKIFFKTGEWEKIQKILLKETKALQKEKNLVLTVEELRAKKRYNAFCDFRDNKAQLTEKEIENLSKAWAHQLQVWGFNNSNINVNPLVQAYGMILLSKGIAIGTDKMTKN